MSEPTPASTLKAPIDTLPVPETPSFKVYRPPSSSAASPPPLPNDYFTPTATDLVNAPLQLRAVRDAADKSKRDRWPNITIRIRFADGTQLEKVFPSTSKIRAIYAFVRGALAADVQPVKFVLCASPRRQFSP
ncbi:hypothetical protein DFH09DRAFT_215810 [Mycena vulgaris]|nr:hypothetical protein DFH09DRAFT_215810 [Mycena vulgaris]